MRNIEIHSELSADVAVSVVVFNTQESELISVLRSLSGSRVRVSVTVVDNSAVATLEPVAAFFGATYIHLHRNVGFGAAHNVAIARTLRSARYHAVLNPDISFDLDVMQQLCDFMDEHPEVAQAMPAVTNTDGSEQRLAKRLPTPFDLLIRRFLGKAGKVIVPEFWSRYEVRDLDLSQPCEIPCLSGCFMFLRTSMLETAGLFDERFFLYMEDFDLCRRMGSIGKTVIFPEAVVVHRYEKGSYRKLRLLLLHLMSSYRYFSKWGWFKDPTRVIRNRRCGGLLGPPSTTTKEESLSRQVA